MKVMIIGEPKMFKFKEDVMKSSLNIVYEYSSNISMVSKDADAVISFDSTINELIEFKNQNPRKLLVIIKENQLDSEVKDGLYKSKGNIAFNYKKDSIVAYTQDGAIFSVNHTDVINLIQKLYNEKFYQTQIISDKVDVLSPDEIYVLDNYPKYEQDGRVYGTFALRRDNGFITTTRGKDGGIYNYCQVFSINHQTMQINSSQKATLNAPLLDMLLKRNSHIKYLIHGHELKGKKVHSQYEFAGTAGDNNYCVDLKSGEVILLEHHGYLVGFSTVYEVMEFLYEK